MKDGRSPTVEAAYEADPNWWLDNGGLDGEGGYDVDGFDQDGWNRGGFDRADHRREDYVADETKPPHMKDFSAAYRNDALRAGERLMGSLKRRIPRSMSNALLAKVHEMLVARFPESKDNYSGDGTMPKVSPCLVRGINSNREPYIGGYWHSPVETTGCFVVIIEAHPALISGVDPRKTWSASVLMRDGEETQEERFIGLESEEELVERIAEKLKAFQPGRKPHTVYLTDAGTAYAAFGAMEQEQFAELAEQGHAPGDGVATVLAGGRQAALKAFMGDQPRSPGFATMIKRGLDAIEEESFLTPTML